MFSDDFEKKFKDSMNAFLGLALDQERKFNNEEIPDLLVWISFRILGKIVQHKKGDTYRKEKDLYSMYIKKAFLYVLEKKESTKGLSKRFKKDGLEYFLNVFGSKFMLPLFEKKNLYRQIKIKIINEAFERVNIWPPNLQEFMLELLHGFFDKDDTKAEFFSTIINKLKELSSDFISEDLRSRFINKFNIEYECAEQMPKNL